MSWLIIGTLTLSFAWVWSRWFSGPEAWKNDHLDYSVGLIAVCSWLVDVFSLYMNPNLASELSASHNTLGDIGLFIITLAYCTIWIGITFVFIRFRVKVARSQRYND